MQLRRSVETNGNVAPEGINILEAIPEQFLFHSSHGKRHPKSAYRTSLRLISEQWLKVFDALDRLNVELHSGGNTAFSFARDILLHFWWIYRTGDLFSDAVRNFIKIKYQYDLTATVLHEHDSKWPELLARGAKLKPEFFPDEWNKPYPKLIYQLNPCKMTLEFTSNLCRSRAKDMRVSTSFVVDGSHRTNKMPYMAGR